MSSRNSLQCDCKNATDGIPSSNSALLSSGANRISDPSASNWQAEMCCMKQRFEYLFQNGCFSDVVFIVGRLPNMRRISAHKLLLSAASNFFETLFSKNWTQNCDEIPLPDDDPAVLSAVVRFIYTDDIQLTSDIVLEVLDAAKRYNIPRLEIRCVEFLSINLCPENAFTILRHAELFGEQELSESCHTIISDHTEQAIGSEGFLNIGLTCLCSFLKRRSEIKEIDLFKAVLRWSEAECKRSRLPVNPENQRSVLKEALYEVRFPTMSVDEFSSEVAESGLLSDKEIVAVFLYFNKKKPTICFKETPRSCFIVERFPAVSEETYLYSDTSAPETIVFCTDCDIELVGVGMYGFPTGPTKYDVSFALFNISLGVLTYQKSQICNYDGSGRTFKMLFDSPVKIAASKSYEVELSIKGPSSFYGTRGLSSVSVRGKNDKQVTFMFRNSKSRSSFTTVTQGQIPEFLFWF